MGAIVVFTVGLIVGFGIESGAVIVGEGTNPVTPA